jgi:MarR family
MPPRGDVTDVRVSLTSGPVTALVDRLENLGWASRNHHPEDRREVVVTLTKNAWQVGQRRARALPCGHGRRRSHLSCQERAVVLGFLHDLVDDVAQAPHARYRPEARAANASNEHVRSGATRGIDASSGPLQPRSTNQGEPMADKSPRQHQSKKSGKSLKEKRGEKKAKQAEKNPASSPLRTTQTPRVR